MTYVYGILDKKSGTIFNGSVAVVPDKRQMLSYLYRLCKSDGHQFHDFPSDFVLVCLGTIEGDHIVANEKPDWLDEMSDIKQAAYAVQ